MDGDLVKKHPHLLGGDFKINFLFLSTVFFLPLFVFYSQIASQN